MKKRRVLLIDYDMPSPGNQLDRLSHFFAMMKEEGTLRSNVNIKDLVAEVCHIFANSSVKPESTNEEELVVSKPAKTVQVDGVRVNFTLKEFDLLVYLMKNADIAMDKDTIMDVVWGVDCFSDTRVVDTHVKKIRKKLGRYADMIQTVHGFGYRFEEGI